MNIKVLVENTTVSPNIKNQHGLCIYIKTKDHKILFDLGQNNLFLINAAKLGINVNDIDTVVISHAHKDHGGGLGFFLRENTHANVYISKFAFEQYYFSILNIKCYFGLNPLLKGNNNIVLCQEDYSIDANLRLFSKIQGNRLLSTSNRTLFEKFGSIYQQDRFLHEQNLLIRENGKNILFSGCAHKGIINIIDEAKRICGGEIDYVIAGFHLFNPVSRKVESKYLIEEIAKELMKSNTKYYACHCTGKKPFDILHLYMGEQIQYLSTGSCIEI